MTYPASLADDEALFWFGYHNVKAKDQWDGVNRRTRIRGIIRTPYPKAEILQPKVRESA